MPFADPVVDAGQPCLEVREDEMDDGQKLVGHFGIAAFGNGVVIVTALAQVGVTAPVVRDDQRPRNNSNSQFGVQPFFTPFALPSPVHWAVARRSASLSFWHASWRELPLLSLRWS